ncbi:hypothetical protein C0J08_14670 [Marinomonas sp. CT5]|nr:hypothetical protein C0J08_14670 [Marinomonas sp. CT5]
MLLINKVYNLINSGQIVGVIILAFLYISYHIVDRLPQNDLADFIRQLLSLNYFYAIPPTIVMLITIYWANRQKKLYEEKIAHLLEVRKRLMHSNDGDGKQALRKHRTSGINRTEIENDC